MKTVFTNDQLAHVWANQSQAHGRNANGSLYFSGDTIYSYGPHYPLARIYKGFALVNSTGYSVTTAKHTRSVVNALKIITFFVPNVLEPAHPDNLASFENDVAEEFQKILECRELDTGSLDTGELRRQRYYKEALGRKEPSPLVKESREFLHWFTKKAIDRDYARIKKREEKRKQEAAAIAEKYKAELPLWVEHKNTLPIRGNTIEIDWCRVHKNGAEVETTRGARVPLHQAMLLLSTITQLWHSEEKLKSIIGLRIGHFTVDNISGDIITIGCHKISIKQAAEAISLHERNNNEAKSI